MNQFMIVKEIDDQEDRVLLFGEDKNYYVITSRKTNVNIGDKIEYEPYGVNFGWFIKKV